MKAGKERLELTAKQIRLTLGHQLFKQPNTVQTKSLENCFRTEICPFNQTINQFAENPSRTRKNIINFDTTTMKVTKIPQK